MPSDSDFCLLGLKVGIGYSKKNINDVYGPIFKEKNNRYYKNGLRIEFDQDDKVNKIVLEPYEEDGRIVCPFIDLQKVRSEIGKENDNHKMWHYGGEVEQYRWYLDGQEIVLCVVASASYESDRLSPLNIKQGDIHSLEIIRSFSSKVREESDEFADKFFEKFDIYYKYGAYYGGYVYRNRDIIKILDKNENVKFSPEDNELVYLNNDDNYREIRVNSEKTHFNRKELEDAKTHLFVDGNLYYTKVERLIAELDHHENCLSEMSLWCNDKKLTNFILYHSEGDYRNAAISVNPTELGPAIWIYDKDNYVIRSRPYGDKNRFSYSAWDTEFLINGDVYTNEYLDHITSLYLIIENKNIKQILCGNSLWGWRGKHFVHNLEDNKNYFLYEGSTPLSMQRKENKL